MHNRSDFRKLLLTALISQSGSHFLTLALAALVLSESGSLIKSSFIFVLSYLPSIFVCGPIGPWIDRNVSKKLLIRNEALAIGMTLMSAAAIAFKLPFIALCALMAARSVLLFVSRTVMTKWIKVISPESIQSDRIKLFFLSFFLSTALSGLLASLFLHSASIWLIATVDVITYCLGIMLIVSLRDIDSKRIGASKSQNVSSFSSVAISHEMRLSFTAVMMSQAIFQGAYTILVSYLPIKHFPLGLSGIGLFQLAASVGIILGFLCNWRFASLLKDRDGAFPKLIAAVVIAAICVYQIINAPLANSLIAFCAMNLVYECIWLFYNTEFFKRSPTEHSGTYQFTLSAWSAFVMAVFTFAYAIAIDTLGLLHGVELVLSLGLLIWMALIFAPSVKYKSASEAKV